MLPTFLFLSLPLQSAAVPEVPSSSEPDPTRDAPSPARGAPIGLSPPDFPITMASSSAAAADLEEERVCLRAMMAGLGLGLGGDDGDGDGDGGFLDRDGLARVCQAVGMERLPDEVGIN